MPLDLTIRDPSKARAAFAAAARVARENAPLRVDKKLAGGEVRALRYPSPLNHVLLRAGPDGEGARFLATDRRAWASVPVPGAEVRGAGSVLLPPAPFLGVLESAGAKPLKVLQSDHDAGATCSFGRASVVVKCADPGLFPEPPEDSRALGHVLPAAAFARLIDLVGFACLGETSPGNDAMRGVCWEYGHPQGRLEAIGTDGRRLAWAWAPCEPPGPGTPPKPVVPKSEAMLMAALAREAASADGDAKASLAFSKAGAFRFEAGGAVLVGRCLEGKFPAWGESIGPEGKARLGWEKAEDLLRALDQAAVCCDEESRAVDMKLLDGKLALFSWGPASGVASVDLPHADAAPGPEFSLDPRLFRPALVALGAAGPVALSAADGRHAIRLEGPGFLFACMPLSRDSAIRRPWEASGASAEPEPATA